MEWAVEPRRVPPSFECVAGPSPRRSVLAIIVVAAATTKTAAATVNCQHCIMNIDIRLDRLMLKKYILYCKANIVLISTSIVSEILYYFTLLMPKQESP